MASTGPASSTGLPITLRMRPRTPRPTGTEIGTPVFVTGMPRTRPSVVSIATQRTVCSPRCWATSTVRLSASSLIAGLDRVSAVLISGRSAASNATSTTGPMTWTILPVLWVVADMVRSSSPRAQPLRASAPLMISSSSLVMAAWRARLY